MPLYAYTPAQTIAEPLPNLSYSTKLRSAYLPHWCLHIGHTERKLKKFNLILFVNSTVRQIRSCPADHRQTIIAVFLSDRPPGSIPLQPHLLDLDAANNSSSISVRNIV